MQIISAGSQPIYVPAVFTTTVLTALLPSWLIAILAFVTLQTLWPSVVVGIVTGVVFYSRQVARTAALAKAKELDLAITKFTKLLEQEAAIEGGTNVTRIGRKGPPTTPSTH